VTVANNVTVAYKATVANKVTVANNLTVTNNVTVAYKATVANKVTVTNKPTVANNVTGNRRQNRPNMVALLEDLFRVPHFSSDFKAGDRKQHVSASIHAPHMYHRCLIQKSNQMLLHDFTAVFGLSHTCNMQLLSLGQSHQLKLSDTLNISYRSVSIFPEYNQRETV
jgi:hypothetical protein